MRAALVCACVFAAGVACRETPPTRAPRALRVAMAPELGTLDPHRQTSHGALSALSNVFEALTAFDDDMSVVPALALRWESPDELTWRFHLRPGVVFHDGRPLTAADVVASLERARRPGHSAEGSLGTVAELTAPASDVVQIRTTRANPMLLNNLATAFVVPHDAPTEITAPIGTGAYRFVSFSPRDGLELSAWDQHWQGRPSEPWLSFLFEPDAEKRLALLAAGSVDVALRVPETATDANDDGYRLLFRSAPAARVLALRVDAPPFSDLRIRRAVSLALDRERVSRELLAGRAQPLGQMLTPGIFGYVSDRPAPARDLPAARALLADAHAGRLALTLDHGAGRRLEAEAIAGQLAEAGLRVTLRTREVHDLLPSLESGRVQMVLLSYVYAAGDAIDIFESMLHGRDVARRFGAENRFGYRNPRVDALIETGAAAATISARRNAYQAAMRLVSDDLPVVPLWEVPWVYGVRNDIDWSPVAHGWFLAASAHRR